MISLGEVSTPDLIQTSNFVDKIYDLLAEPKRWTQKMISRTSKGLEIGPTDSLATCWCLAGAIEKVTKLHNFTPIIKKTSRELLKKEALNRKFNLLCNLNDAYNHQQLLEYLAICKDLVTQELNSR